MRFHDRYLQNSWFLVAIMALMRRTPMDCSRDYSVRVAKGKVSRWVPACTGARAAPLLGEYVLDACARMAAALDREADTFANEEYVVVKALRFCAKTLRVNASYIECPLAIVDTGSD